MNGQAESLGVAIAAERVAREELARGIQPSAGAGGIERELRVLVPEWIDPAYHGATGRVLQLGCGLRPMVDAYNHNNAAGADTVMPYVDAFRNLELMPWDSAVEGQDVIAGAFDTVIALDVIEHLEDVLGFTVEAARLLVPGGRLILRSAAHDNPVSFRDPTHRHQLTDESLDFICTNTMLGRHYGAFYVDTLGRSVDHYRKLSVERTNPDPRWPDNGDWLYVLERI